MKAKNITNSNFNVSSAFWLDKDLFKPEGETSSITKNLKLLAYKRSISNFIKILTKQDGYKVKFSTGDMSYTDGKTVVISSKLNENNFDVTVGLALHEASHLLLTDFNIIKDPKFKTLGADELGHLYLSLNIEKFAFIRTLHNIVEDRYIDDFVYSTAPGYRGYYNALYNYYFRKQELTDWLKKPKQRTETYQNYKSQLLNIVNSEFDINCLKGMPEIVKLLDLANISRLTTTESRLRLSMQIFKIVENYVSSAEFEPKEEEPKKEKNKIPQSNNNESDNESTDSLDNDTDDTEKDENLDLNSNDSGETAEGEDSTSTKSINKILKDLDKFMNGQLSEDEPSASTRANSKLNDKIDALDMSDASEEISMFKGEKVKVLLVKNITYEVGRAEIYKSIFTIPDPAARRSISRGTVTLMSEKIAEGTYLGARLAQKMMIRNEEKSLVVNRLNSGKIFNRHVAMLGADVENIFFKTKTDTYKNSTIHISIDASGSMTGVRFEDAIVTATAIAKACTYLKGIDCIISFRSQQEKHPMILIGYNSKVDHFSKIPELFKYLYANSSTPEGLCYDVYGNYINKIDKEDVDKYLINLSDGEPAFHLSGTSITYGGREACEHGRQAWQKIMKSGVTGLSYFITDKDIQLSKSPFFTMYGKESRQILSGNLVQLTKTINDMLMSNNAMKSIYSE